MEQRVNSTQRGREREGFTKEMKYADLKGPIESFEEVIELCILSNSLL